MYHYGTEIVIDKYRKYLKLKAEYEVIQVIIGRYINTENISEVEYLMIKCFQLCKK